MLCIAAKNPDVVLAAADDTAHGTAHRDILGLKRGLLEKEWFFAFSNEGVFLYAIRDFKDNAQERIRFFCAN